MGGQLIQIFVGQYGVQVGSACWELFCAENGISEAGCAQWKSDEHGSLGHEAFFTEASSGQFVPRCVLIDAEPSVIDEIRVGAYRNLFDPKQLINGWEDSAANFARGYYQNSKRLLGPSLEQLRHLAESCDELQAFVLHHSSGGGTGSGFTCALMREMQDYFPKSCRLELALAPSEVLSSSTVEPYNALLGMHTPMEFVDCGILLDNQALIGLCTDRLWLSRISMTHLNRLIAQAVSGLFSPIGFKTQLSATVNAMLTNLVPYPDAHFVTGALTPLRCEKTGAHYSSSCFELTQSAFEPQHQLLYCVPEHRSVYLSCCLLYRGSVSSRQVNDAIHKLKIAGQLPWVDWCPTGFKVAITHQPMTAIRDSYISPVPCSLLTLHNSTVFLPSLARLVSEFRQLYTRRAFLHWFLNEGMDGDEFGEALRMLSALRDQYAQFQEMNNGHRLFSAESSESSLELSNSKPKLVQPNLGKSDLMPESPLDPMRNYSAMPGMRNLTQSGTTRNSSYIADRAQTDTLHGLSSAGLFGQPEKVPSDATLQPWYSSLSSVAVPTIELFESNLFDPEGRKPSWCGGDQLLKVDRAHKSTKTRHLHNHSGHKQMCRRRIAIHELAKTNLRFRNDQLRSPWFWIKSTPMLPADELPSDETKQTEAVNSFLVQMSAPDSQVPISTSASCISSTKSTTCHCTVDVSNPENTDDNRSDTTYVYL